MARVDCVVRKGEYTKSWTGSARQSTGMSITRARQDDDPEAVQQEHLSKRELNVP
jgi:hypothetical protein